MRSSAFENGPIKLAGSFASSAAARISASSSGVNSGSALRAKGMLRVVATLVKKRRTAVVASIPLGAIAK